MDNSGENAKLLLALENITDEDLKCFDYKKNAESVRKSKIDLKSHLFTALRSGFQNMNFSICAKILKHLASNGLCGKEFVLQIIAVLFGRDSSNFKPSLYLNALNHLSKSESLRYEVRLLKFIHYLSEDSWEDALNVISHEGRQGDLARKDSSVNSCSNLLLGFKVLLKYLIIKSTGQELPKSMPTEFPKISSQMFTPSIAEACTKTILELATEEEAEEFIHKYVECEIPNSGLLAPLHAFAIVKQCMPQNRALNFFLLEKIAKLDCTHPLVLDLSWKYLCKDIPLKLRKNQTISKCLELVFSFLDVNLENSQAWDILSQSLRMVCISGEEESIACVVKLWYRDRRNWWPNECFPTQCKVTEVDAYIDNKTLVCFILESKKHPFVASMLAIKEGQRHNNLQSLIKQLKKPKSHFDSQVKLLLDSTAESPCASLIEIPETNPPNIQTAHIATTSVSCRSPEIAIDYPVYIAGTLPICKRRIDQRKTSDHRENCLSLYQLPIIERLSKRYNVKKRERNTNQSGKESSSDSEDELVDNLVAPRNKFRPYVGANIKKKILEHYQMSRNTPRMTPPPSDIPRSSGSSSEDEAYHTKIAYSPTIDVHRKLRHTSDARDDANLEISSSQELREERFPSLSGDAEIMADAKKKWANFISESIWEKSSASEESDGSDDQRNLSISSHSSDSSKIKAGSRNSTEMTLSNLTPDLQFMVSPNPPRQGLIRNEDHYAFLNLTQESESSGKNQVSVKVTQIIDALRDEDSSSDESEIDIVIDDKSSKSQSEIIRRDGDVGAADCHPQVYSGNLSDTPISGEGSSSSEINTSLHSGNDSSTIPSSPSPSLQNESRPTEVSSPDIFLPDISNNDDEESVDCVLSSTQKSIPRQLQFSLDAGYSTPSVPIRKKIKHPPLSVIAHHPSTRLRGKSSTKSAIKSDPTPQKKKSEKAEIKKNLPDGDISSGSVCTPMSSRNIQHEKVSPTTAIVEREMLIAELMNSCKQSVVKVKHPSTSKRRKSKVSNEIVRSQLDIDSITSSIVDTVLKENEAKSTGKGKKKSPVVQLNEPGSPELFNSNQINNTPGNFHLENKQLQLTRNSKKSSTDQPLKMLSVTDKPILNQLEASNLSESSSSSQRSSTSTALRLSSKIGDIRPTSCSTLETQSAKKITKKNMKNKTSKLVIDSEVTPAFGFDSDKQVVGSGGVPSFSEFSTDLDDSRSTPSQIATSQRMITSQSDTSRRDLRLVEQLIATASKPNKGPSQNKLKRLKHQTPRSGIEQQTKDIVDRLVCLSSKKTETQRAPSKISSIDKHNTELVEQLYHQLQVEEQVTELLAEKQTNSTKSPKKVKSKSSKSFKAYDSSATFQEQIEEQPRELLTHTKSSESGKLKASQLSTSKVSECPVTTQDQIEEQPLEQSTSVKSSNKVESKASKLSLKISKRSKTSKQPIKEKSTKQPTEKKSKKTKSSKVEWNASKFTCSSMIDRHNMELVDQLINQQSNFQPAVAASLPPSIPSRGIAELKQKRSASKAQLHGPLDEPPVKLRKVKSSPESANKHTTNESLIDLLSDYVKHLPDD